MQWRKIVPVMASPEEPDEDAGGTEHYHPAIFGLDPADQGPRGDAIPPSGDRMRVYVLDAGDGSPIAILVTTEPGAFDRVVEEATPLIEGFTFGGAG
jgi:hypothetical protein